LEENAYTARDINIPDSINHCSVIGTGLCCD